jgi:hypothetical protein
MQRISLMCNLADPLGEKVRTISRSEEALGGARWNCRWSRKLAQAKLSAQRSEYTCDKRQGNLFTGAV